MDQHRLGITLVVDQARRLIGTVTDGDIRRAILAKIDLQAPVGTLLARKAGTPYANPITALAGTERGICLRLLQDHNILHLPLLDAHGRVAELLALDDFLPDRMVPLQAIIMAGGAGRRLQPLTDETPKPMLPVGNRPIMEIIIERLRASGIRRVSVALHHRAEQITRHFGNGEDFGVEMKYVTEDRPLGTAGSLALLEPLRETLLVINGDILTQVDFRAMAAYHREHRADLTVGVTRFELQVPYGVVECEESLVRSLREKPVMVFFVNAGIYLIEPEVQRYVPNGRRFDMPDLIQSLLDGGRSVVSFPIHETWLDIGSPEDYRRAQYAGHGLKQGT